MKQSIVVKPSKHSNTIIKITNSGLVIVVPPKKGKTEMMKKLVWQIIIHSIIWIYLTYILAFLGKDNIAENLSSNIVTVILGTVVSYAAKSLFEKMSRNKHGVTLADDTNTETNNNSPAVEPVKTDEKGWVTERYGI